MERSDKIEAAYETIERLAKRFTAEERLAIEYLTYSVDATHLAMAFEAAIDKLPPIKVQDVL